MSTLMLGPPWKNPFQLWWCHYPKMYMAMKVNLCNPGSNKGVVHVLDRGPFNTVAPGRCGSWTQEHGSSRSFIVFQQVLTQVATIELCHILNLCTILTRNDHLQCSLGVGDCRDGVPYVPNLKMNLHIREKWRDRHMDVGWPNKMKQI